MLEDLMDHLQIFMTSYLLLFIYGLPRSCCSPA